MFVIPLQSPGIHEKHLLKNPKLAVKIAIFD